MRHLSFPLMLSVLGIASLCRATEPSSPLRVMSFNIRFGTANDGDNHWEKRKQFLLDTVRQFDPDLLGTQETLDFQRDFLESHLKGYGVVGVGRDDGQNAGEMMALYYRKERFDRLSEGHYWLSETPDKVGSKSWDSSLPRMVSWVRLRERLRPDATPILFLNTHFDHRGSRARLESARLIRNRVVSEGQESRVILTGDFNTAEGSDPYVALFGAIDRQESPLLDTLRIVQPQRGEHEGTFSNFVAGETGGARIDWIGVSRNIKLLEASIDRTARSGRTPSDHFPVTAVLRLP